jgi:iron complex outermembrane receptor protein
MRDGLFGVTMICSSKHTALLTAAVCFTANLAPSLVGAIEGSSSAEIDTLPTTVVSALRYSELDMQIASRVQLIDVKDIANSGATDLVQLLRKETNLHFRSTSGNSVQSEISMGGFGENSGQRVLILLDGHRLNTADIGKINWLSIPLGLIESVEVIQGGQSALYGNNAIGGVIKITTRKPNDTVSGVFTGSVGSFDAYSGRATVSGRVGNFGYMVYAEHNETDGYRENSEYEGRGAGFKLDWSHENYLNAYLSLSGVESEYGLPGDLSRMDYEEDPRQSDEPDNNGEDDSLYARGGVEIGLGESVKLSLDAGYTERDVSTDFVSIFTVIEQEYTIYSFLPAITYEKNGFIAVAGLDYYDDSVGGSNISTFPGFEGVTPFIYERENLGGYLSAKVPLSENTNVSVSFRVEESETTGEFGGSSLNSTEEEQHAWSFGLNHILSDSARLYGAVRRFYRYPATDELFVFGPPPSFNAELEPEWGHQFEVGADWSSGDLTLGGRLYHQQMHDEMVLNVFLGAVGENVNLDETSRWGADFSASYALTKSVDLSLQCSWVDAKIVGGDFDGSKVPLVSEYKARFVVDYRASESITITTGATFTHEAVIGSDFANALETLEEYILIDLSVRYKLNEHIEFFATVDNLFDEEYQSTGFANRVGTEGFYPGVGRSAKLGASIRF